MSMFLRKIDNNADYQKKNNRNKFSDVISYKKLL